METPIDVIIIGAGVSGLTAGYKILQKSNLKVLIVETSDRIGGQLQSSSAGEIGGKYITEDQYHIYNLLRVLGVHTTRQTQLGANLKHCWDIGRGFLHWFYSFEVKRFIQEIDFRSQTYRPGSFKLHRHGRSMEKVIKSKLFFNRSRNHLRALVRLACGVDPKYVTYEEFMSTCCGCGGFSMIISLYTGIQQSLLEFSTEDYLRAIEKEIEGSGSGILTKTRVSEIYHCPDYAIVRDTTGKEFMTHVVVLAIPWNQVMDLYVHPPIPMELRTPPQFGENRLMMTSFVAHYDNGHWRRHGFSGSVFSVDNVPLLAHELTPRTLAGVILHDDGFEMIAKNVILESLASSLGDEMRLPLTYVQRTFEQSALLNLPQTTPWHNLVWASSGAATAYRGCLSGAVQGGLRAAINALLILRPQNVNWEDISEIQRANAVHVRTGPMTVITKSINIYNSVYYGALALFACYVFVARARLYACIPSSWLGI